MSVSSDARELFFSFSNASHFSIGVDALWLDATEPEYLPNHDHMLASGSGNALMNAYSLMTTRAITNGLRAHYASAQGARPFSLTRSSFAGQQGDGACLWTGDTNGSWPMLQRQVASSLNYQLSGIPYWSQDIGGFFRPQDQYVSPSYHSLLLRWFQFGVFTPIYRVHGAGTNTEPWNYGPDVLRYVNQTNNLRYRFLPYTYSGFWKVERDGYTMQRHLIFDHALADDEPVIAMIEDQFMYGPSLLVAPVVNPEDDARNTRSVYLPQLTRGNWSSFWTGTALSPGTTVVAPAPMSASPPLFVRPGSVVLLGTTKQYAFDGDDTLLEVRIYPGDDGRFDLYEDDGRTSQYREAGAYSVIPFEWDDASRSLVIGAQQQGGAGYATPAERSFHVSVVREGHAVGLAFTTDSDRVVKYTGQRVVVAMP